MSRRTLAAVGSVLAVLIAAALALWAGGGDGGAPTGARPTSSVPGSGSGSGSGSASVDPDSGLPWVDERDLPTEARHTLDLIDAGGPFPYPGKDGSAFGNLEGLLPAQPRGYYAEYTVATPGSDDRGARRIVTGDAGEYYWTDDHYQSFERIRR